MVFRALSVWRAGKPGVCRVLGGCHEKTHHRSGPGCDACRRWRRRVCLGEPADRRRCAFRGLSHGARGVELAAHAWVNTNAAPSAASSVAPVFWSSELNPGSAGFSHPGNLLAPGTYDVGALMAGRAGCADLWQAIEIGAFASVADAPRRVVAFPSIQWFMTYRRPARDFPDVYSSRAFEAFMAERRYIRWAEASRWLSARPSTCARRAGERGTRRAHRARCG
ncbi:MAG: D-alanyl-lipoteichoic acid biosynthesis protein DltD [Collinsella sp.]